MGTGVWLSLFLVACGSDDAGGGTASGGADWQLLTSLNWQVDSGQEDWTCTRKTVDKDLLITQFEPFSSNGTHHTLLTIGAPSAPDGPFGCDLYESRSLLLSATAGSNTLVLPDGVAMRVRAGQQFFLGLHLFNATPAPLRGSSGVRALIAKPATAPIEAEAITVWAQDFVLPAGRETVTTGACTLTHESTVFALHPHMHTLGTHVKVLAHTGGTVRVFHDARFEFEKQLIHPVQPLKLLPGDRVEIECTHRNTRDSEVAYGGSSSAEMCLVELYRYPASSDGGFYCR